MNKEEFIEVIRNNRNLIYKVCNTYCQDETNRQDLEQEILMQLWISFQRFDGRVKITTWMYKIALNTAISFYRKDSKFKKNSAEVDISLISPENDDNNIKNERISLLYSFISELNDMDKALILLYLDDNKQKEIAEILGITETNVATKISRIKQSLKNQFIHYQKD